ncbi:hypothetical protein OA92_13435 [Marinomonas sp. SBI22]|uniref:GNAT family N-acetyltransferase n=1 Tax=unclassified Marinomonas TaxID=196814 RepID=UPI0007BBDE27|nr:MULTISPECIES: GNAT family N-acetyltransferase [unclassified Marinomonas]KZM41414.1 hypothetical protein OA92_13435 [Marinomonas sp. SBI22]KZM43250.1 hypothetical protein OA91_11640 [Marinomonas sp. SBI8L]
MTYTFSSSRLTVLEANNLLSSPDKASLSQKQFDKVLLNKKQIDKKELYQSIIKILTPEVVSQLPPYFSDINSRESAQAWLERMLDESLLFLVYQTELQQLIGFSFIYLEQTDEGQKNAHLGYLLAQASWGKGFASELVSHLIEHIKTRNLAETLIAGVDESNLASIALLKKLGFNQSKSDVPENLFFQLKLNN